MIKNSTEHADVAIDRARRETPRATARRGGQAEGGTVELVDNRTPPRITIEQKTNDIKFWLVWSCCEFGNSGNSF